MLSCVCCCLLLSWNDVPLPDQPRAIIRVAQTLQPAIDDLLANSPTFAAQWRDVLANPSLYVTISHATLPMGCRAQTKIGRYGAGVIRVAMTIGDAAHARELVAHELEHLREYLEGGHRTHVTTRGPAGRWTDAKGRVETARALETERRVREELLVSTARP
jgi:hypothetical protein